MLLHQIWFQGAAKAPEKYAANRASWRKNHPRAKIRTWDAESIEALIDKHYAEWRFLYDLMPLMIQKIDLGKVFIMHRYGGSYVDMDTESLKPLDEFVLAPGITLSYVNSNWFEHWALGMLRGVGTKRFVNNGIMICPRAKDPFWIYYLERLRLEMCPRDGPRGRKLLERLAGDSVYVMNTTGPLLFTDSVHAWNRSHPASIRILHHSYLEPVFGRDPEYLKKTFPWSYVKHDHEGSWTRDPCTIRILTVYYHWIRPYWWAWLLIVIVSGVLLV